MTGDLFAGHGTALRGDVEFSEFYRCRLRRVQGARARSADIMAAHAAWALQERAQPIHWRRLRHFMQARGHWHFYSDGAWYRDVEIVAADAVPTGDADRHRYELSFALDLVARIDVIADELAALRARLAEAVR